MQGPCTRTRLEVLSAIAWLRQLTGLCPRGRTNSGGGLGRRLVITAAEIVRAGQQRRKFHYLEENAKSKDRPV